MNNLTILRPFILVQLYEEGAYSETTSWNTFKKTLSNITICIIFISKTWSSEIEPCINWHWSSHARRIFLTPPCQTHLNSLSTGRSLTDREKKRERGGGRGTGIFSSRLSSKEKKKIFKDDSLRCRYAWNEMWLTLFLCTYEYGCVVGTYVNGDWTSWSDLRSTWPPACLA